MTTVHDEVMQALSSMSVEEVLSLIRALEQRWKISAVPVPQPAERTIASAYGGPPPPDRRRLDLIDPGPNKQHVLIFLRNRVRELGEQPIADVKRRIEAGPMQIVDNSDCRADMLDIMKALEELGAKVELVKPNE